MVLKEGGDPLTASYSPSPSGEKDASDGSTQQGLEKTSISDICLTTTHSIIDGERTTIYIFNKNTYAIPCPEEEHVRKHPNISVSVFVPSDSFFPGLQLKTDNQDHPFACFTYALYPLAVKLTPVDWKVLVTKSMECQHVRCYELQTRDNLPELITGFLKTNAVAVVLINTSDDYVLHPSFLTGLQESHIDIPVLLLTKNDGMTLLDMLEQCKENVWAKITVESGVDAPTSLETMQDKENEPPLINSDQTAPKQPGQCVV